MIQSNLELDWSPQLIAVWLRMEYPQRLQWHVYHETIYQALYHGARRGPTRAVTMYRLGVVLDLVGCSTKVGARARPFVDLRRNGPFGLPRPDSSILTRPKQRSPGGQEVVVGHAR